MTRTFIASLIVLSAVLAAGQGRTPQTPTTQTSQTDKVETKEQRDARMPWWREARFGLLCSTARRARGTSSRRRPTEGTH
jgi:hypothetical protein